MLCDAGLNLADYIHTTPVCSRCLVYSSLFLAIKSTIGELAKMLSLDVISLRPRSVLRPPVPHAAQLLFRYFVT